MFRELDASGKIIADLLDFARERKPAYNPCPLRPLVDEAIGLVPKSAVRLVNEVPEDLPIPSMDKDQFRQVLVNLIQNGAEAASGKPEGEVVVRAEGGTGTSPWLVRVIDNGTGMPRDVLDKIFQPLYTTKVKGTGLGLAVVWNMVHAHKGTIHARSEEGKGTEFTISLPHDVERAGTVGRHARSHGRVMNLPMRILLVDDEQSLLMTLAANLELDGFDVTTAESGQRALELFEKTTFDLGPLRHPHARHERRRPVPAHPGRATGLSRWC